MNICDSSSDACTHCPSPDRCALDQRGEDAERGVKPGHDIGDRNADPHRPAAGLAGHRHQPAHALHDLIDAGPILVGTVLPEGRDAGEMRRGFFALSVS